MPGRGPVVVDTTLTNADLNTWLSTKRTDNLIEGATNLYYTQARFDSAFSGKTTTDLVEGTNQYYTAARFNSAFAGKTTADLTENTNLYYTAARFNSAFAGKTTADLTENTNLYYTAARFNSAFAASSHNSLQDLATGDVHTQYPLSVGRAGGQIQYGGTAASENYTCSSTYNLTKGKIQWGTGVAYCIFNESTAMFGIGIDPTLANLHVAGNGIFNSGMVVNESGADSDSRFEGNTDANLLYIDAGADCVGIGTSSPNEKLDINGHVCFNHDKTFKKVGASGGVLFWVGDELEFLNSTASNGYGHRIYTADPGGGTVLRIAARSNAASFTDYVFFHDNGGVVVGTSTNNGAGTLTVQTDCYKGASAYTNPDYVFEHHFTGKIKKFIENPGAKEYEGLPKLTEIEKYCKKNLRLPGIDDNPSGSFKRSDIVLTFIEQLFLYIFELKAEIEALKS